MRSAKSLHQNSDTVPEQSHCSTIPAPDKTLMRPRSASSFRIGLWAGGAPAELPAPPAPHFAAPFFPLPHSGAP